MAKQKVPSIEPIIADLANGWLRSYKLDYKLEQEPLNTEIDKALADYFTKNGGSGANRPDAKLLLQDKELHYYPVLIEYKGYKDRLEKLDNFGQVENKTSKNEPNFKNINSYAVNGAVHYANAILHYTSYTDIIAVGMTGYKDDFGKVQYQIGVYYVSKSNFGVGQKIGEFSDLSFLAPNNFDTFIAKVKTLSLTQEEIEKIREQRDAEITANLTKLNNDIYQEEDGLSEKDRVYLVAASIIATLGIPGKVTPLKKSDLKSSIEKGDTDGEIMVRKIKAFLNEKNIPNEKKDFIVRTLENTLTTENINKVENGESQLKRVFTKIIDDLGFYYKIGLTTDFTGKLFNEMYRWLGFSKDTLNDVVLTPSYVATLLVKLARVNRNSFVWDFATGSAGLLVAAMNEMLSDARNNIHSLKELEIKETNIRTLQLLGIELLDDIYMLAILNMIIMGDGSSNIINKNSLTDFDGKYAYGEPKEKDFPADAFVLNPPYSKAGNGMVFVEKALNMMNKGYAAIIIQSSAGSGKAIEYNKRILKRNTLLASIKMPSDLFIGKSSVQTNIYVFRVNEPHCEGEMVKFIDFSNDGYTRTNRRKASSNLKDTDNAQERYEEIVKLVRYGRGVNDCNIHYFKDCYIEDYITLNGDDWTYEQHFQIDLRPTAEDFRKIVKDYLAWCVSKIIKKEEELLQKRSTPCLYEQEQKFLKKGGKFKTCKASELFEIKANPQLDKSNFVFSENSKYPYFTRTVANNGILGYVDYLDEEHKIRGNSLAVGMLGMKFFYMKHDFYAGQFTKTAFPLFEGFNEKVALWFIAWFNKSSKRFQSVLVRNFEKEFNNTEVVVPYVNGNIAIDYIEECILELKKERMYELEQEYILELKSYLDAAGLEDIYAIGAGNICMKK